MFEVIAVVLLYLAVWGGAAYLEVGLNWNGFGIAGGLVCLWIVFKPLVKAAAQWKARTTPPPSVPRWTLPAPAPETDPLWDANNQASIPVMIGTLGILALGLAVVSLGRVTGWWEWDLNEMAKAVSPSP